MLPTAVVKVVVPNRKPRYARVMLDTCSQVNLVHVDFAKKAKIKGSPNGFSYTLDTLSGPSAPIESSAVFKIQSRLNDFELELCCDITSYIPYKHYSRPAANIRSILPNKIYADERLPYDHVDILLGAQYAERCCLDTREFINNEFVLRDSHFGWLIQGVVPNACMASTVIVAPPVCLMTTNGVESQLRKFWEIEETTSVNENISELNICVEHFEKNVTRTSENRFMVRLPLKNDRAVLGESRNNALRSLLRNERRLNPEVQQQYAAFMREYLEMGHMREVPISESGGGYYIPHRAVIRPTALTTKLRVVFNASAKTSTGFSLNDICEIGPKVQRDLIDILLSFRLHRIVFTCDIEKMYCQVLVHPSDTSLQKSESQHEPIKEFELCTVTYGTAPASFLAQYCLKVLSDELRETNPVEADAVSHDFYMDDLLTGGEDLPEVRFTISLKNLVSRCENTRVTRPNF